MENILKKKGSTLFLRLALILIALAALALCILAFPEMWRSFTFEDQMFMKPGRAIIIGMYASALPFLIALWQSWKLLGFIDKNIAFSELSTKALGNIKYCAIAISVFMAAASPFFYMFAQLDDAPGVVVISMGFVGAALVVAVFAALLQKLLRNAIDMKRENELTV